VREVSASESTSMLTFTSRHVVPSRRVASRRVAPRRGATRRGEGDWFRHGGWRDSDRRRGCGFSNVPSTRTGKPDRKLALANMAHPSRRASERAS